MSTETLSFNGRVNIARRAIEKEFGELPLLEASASLKNMSHTTQNITEMENMVVSFLVDEHTIVVIKEEAYGKFEKSAVRKQRPLGCNPISQPVSMDLKEAQSLKNSKYPDIGFNAVLLQVSVIAGPKHPCFLFQGKTGYVLVNTATREVTFEKKQPS